MDEYRNEESEAVGSCLSCNRHYLAELKAFVDLYTPKSIVLYGVKAGIIPSNYVMSEFNAHMIEAENRRFWLGEVDPQRRQIISTILSETVPIKGVAQSFREVHKQSLTEQWLYCG